MLLKHLISHYKKYFTNIISKTFKQFMLVDNLSKNVCQKLLANILASSFQVYSAVHISERNMWKWMLDQNLQ